MRTRGLRGGDHRHLQIARRHRGRNGSPDRGESRSVDRLRYVQGRRPRNGGDRSAPVAQIGRQVRELGGRTVISVEEALSRLLAPLEKLPLEQVSIADAIGRVLAEDLAARRTQPPFAVSAMDGYAVRAEDLATVPVELRIVAEVPAGAGVCGHDGAGGAAPLLSPRPPPAHPPTSVLQEDTQREGDRVRVLEGASRG